MYICIHIYLHELCGCTCVYVYICIHIYAICVRDIHTHDHYHHLRHKHESLSKIQKLHLHELADSQLWTRARGWTWNRANKKSDTGSHSSSGASVERISCHISQAWFLRSTVPNNRTYVWQTYVYTPPARQHRALHAAATMLAGPARRLLHPFAWLKAV